MFSSQPTFYLQTVEINNTDAEGRLVLADGVAYAARYETLKLSHTFSDCGFALDQFFLCNRVMVISIGGAIYTESSIKYLPGSLLVTLYTIITSLFCHDY